MLVSVNRVGHSPRPHQTRQLRLLAEGEFYRVGGQSRIRVDVRVIAATHQNLEERSRSGQFRVDLYHRVNVIRIDLPPLRERRADIPELLRHYLQVAARELGVEPKALTAEAGERLGSYPWPGNVRELVNFCRRATALAPGKEIRVADLPAAIIGAASAGTAAAEGTAALAGGAEAQITPTASQPLLDVAPPPVWRTLLRIALKATQGHRQEAARLLGWGRNTLTRKLRELGMEGAEDPD